MQNNYILFKKRKEELVNFIKESSDILNKISLNQHANGLDTLGQKVNSDTFRIQIIGTFKNGKSTFINALLGEDILPARVLPCTAVINEIKYGESKKAILNFRNPLPNPLLEGIPEETLNHMKSHKMTNVPPMEIDYDKISDYVTIPIDGAPEEISLKSPYLSVELFYTSDFLKEGVEIIDSPGLNENEERTTVTLEYLDKADAIIFLLDATKLCAKDEIDTIDRILVPKGFDDMFFIVNRIDLISRVDEISDIKRFAEKNVQAYTKNSIFYLSSLNALDGKIQKDEAKLRSSGLLEFEANLSEFLIKEKGRIKLIKSLKELKGILTTEALYKAIPSQRQQLSTDRQELECKYEEIKPQLDASESQKKLLKTTLELKVQNTEDKIKRAINEQFLNIANLVPGWINNYKPKNTPGVFATKKQVEIVADEIIKYVSSKVKENYSVWNKQVLTPLVEGSATEIFEKQDEALKTIFVGIDQIESGFSGTSIQDNSSGWTRALGVAGICCGFASGASLLTGQLDVKTIGKSLAVDLGVNMGMVLLGVTNPVLAIGAIVAIAFQSIIFGANTVVDNLKTELQKKIQSSIREASVAKSTEIVAKIDVEFQKSISTAIQAIDIKINDLKEQVEKILEEKENGQEFVNKRLELLGESENRLQEICQGLDRLMIDLV